MARPPQLLGATDLAAMNNVTPRTARRWLKAWYRRRSLGVVKKLGNKYVTTEEALQRVLPDRPLTDTARRLHALEGKVSDHERLTKADRAELRAVQQEVRSLRSEMRSFWAKAHEWFADHSKIAEGKRTQADTSGRGNVGTG